MMKILKRCMLFVFALALIGCAPTPIKSTNMLGNYTLKLSASEWDGEWVSGNITYQFKVLNQDFGIMQSVSVEEGETKKRRIFVTYNGDNKYINLVDSDKRFIFMQFKKEKDKVTAWKPSKALLKKAIENNEIKGEVNKNGNILITASNKEFLLFIKTNPDLKIFDYEAPTIFTRVTE